ncbi:MAG: hypothetical protein VB071_15455 [Lawsonibacter sp.]|nr:hypothetical protein [Lawsonibacter sp.]
MQFQNFVGSSVMIGSGEIQKYQWFVGRQQEVFKIINLGALLGSTGALVAPFTFPLEQMLLTLEQLPLPFWLVPKQSMRIVVPKPITLLDKPKRSSKRVVEGNHPFAAFTRHFIDSKLANISIFPHSGHRYICGIGF